MIVILHESQRLCPGHQCYCLDLNNNTGGQDQTDNAALLPNKLVKLEDCEGCNEGESMKKRQ